MIYPVEMTGQVSDEVIPVTLELWFLEVKITDYVDRHPVG